MKYKIYLLAFLLIFVLIGCESKAKNNIVNTVVGEEQSSKEPDSELVTTTPEPTVTEKPVVIEEKEIVFLNNLLGYRSLCYEPCNILESVYETQNRETLYAFCIDFEIFLSWQYELPEDYPIQTEDDTYEEWSKKKREFWTKEVLKLIEGTGLILLSDYPYCHYNQESLIDPYNHQKDLRLGLCAVAGTLDEVKELFDETSSFEGLCLWVSNAPRPDLLEKMKEAGWNGFRVRDWFEKNEEKIRKLIGNENQVTMKVKVAKTKN